jgi:hypothetical protein
MWDYKRTESEKNYGPIPVGDYRVRITKAEMAVSSTGNDMINLQFDVSGTNKKLFHHIVNLKDRPEITNRKLTEFYDSFAEIPEGSGDLASWVGKVGAVHVKHREWNGETQAQVGWFIDAKRQSSLPAWVEPQGKQDGESASAAVQADADGFMQIPAGAEELPFD